MAFADAQSGVIIASGELPAEITLAGAVTKGDAVGYSDGWKQALATTSGVIQMRCVAAQDGVTGQKITVYFGITILKGSRYTGAAHQGKLYVAEGSDAGELTQTVPSDSGDADTVVGVALSATVMCLTPNIEVDSTVT